MSTTRPSQSPGECGYPCVRVFSSSPGDLFVKATRHLSIVGILFAMLLAGCSHPSATRPVDRSRVVAPAPVPAPVQKSSTVRRTHTSRPRHRAADEPAQPQQTEMVTSTQLPNRTGIQACDDYLASYKGCHRVAGIYAPADLEHRYQLIRVSLLQDSMNPKVRPLLAARCNALAESLRQALHGKACAVNDAPAAAVSTGTP